jgi:hypothetical protein
MKSIAVFLREPVSTYLPSEANTTSLPGLNLRVEWLKCHAQAVRWKEEIQLIEEEMRWALDFCSWKMMWWDQQAHCRMTAPPHLQEGLVAYATENTAIERRRLMSWSSRGAHRNRTIQTGRVPYYGSVPVPFRGRFNHWTDGGQDGLGLSKAVIVRLSRLYRQLDGCLQTFSR